MKIAVGGQMNKKEIKDYIDSHSDGGRVTCEIFTDTEAAMKVKSGEYDYYVGACQSGAGGALAMAYGVLGRDKCATIGMCGIAPKESKVIDAVQRGCKAFGFTNEQVEPAMSLLLKHLP
ncbi:DUF2620 domain-containing protein [Thermophilibacter sp.]